MTVGIPELWCARRPIRNIPHAIMESAHLEGALPFLAFSEISGNPPGQMEIDSHRIMRVATNPLSGRA